MRTAPMISAVTPIRLTADMTLLSRRLTVVVRARSTTASSAALAAPVAVVGAGSPPTSWNPDQTMRQHHLERERGGGDHDDLPDHHDPAA